MPKLLDLKGKKFGLLTVLKRSENLTYNSQKITSWLCKCECGKTKIIASRRLTGRLVTSCGCLVELQRKNKLVGRSFGNLTVLKRAKDRFRRAYWLCKCICGKETIVCGQHLLAGNSKSCGCIRRLERGLAAKKSKYLHFKITAKKRNLDYSLTFEDFVFLSESRCYYCGSPPANVFKSKNYYGSWTRNGIDRVDSSLAYTKENCVPCCSFCNFMKSNKDIKKFLDHCRKIVEYQESSKERNK